MSNLSSAAKNIWAKKSSSTDYLSWLPLEIHLQDAAGVAQRIWEFWISDGVKQSIVQDCCLDEDSAKKFLVFLAAIHDLGKATPVFQAKQSWPQNIELDDALEMQLMDAGLPNKKSSEFFSAKRTPHALATQILLQNAGLNKNAAAILGSHHGKPPDNDSVLNNGVDAYGENYFLGIMNKEKWMGVQQEFIDFALGLSGFNDLKAVPQPGMKSQVILSGLVIMIDWIASNERYFPLMGLFEKAEVLSQTDRIKRAWKTIDFPDQWFVSNDWMNGDLFKKRFSLRANEIQKAVGQIASENDFPGILVIEAPMGLGKTEAALACAEIFAYKKKRNGVFFALPTQATSDSIFHRLRKWVERLDDESIYSINLAHGKAQFNEEFQSIKGIRESTNIGIDEDDSVIVHDWFSGQKQSLLADFVVGTIDQLLLMGLKQKHVMLRHLGLANKVVIIDEIHAYDAYMNQYLYRVLNWLGEYGIPVIVLSATLPVNKRKHIIDAYLNLDIVSESRDDPLGIGSKKNELKPEWETIQDYPMITYSVDNQVIQQKIVLSDENKRVSIDYIVEDTLVDTLLEATSGGGCVGIIVNTVKKAQNLAIELREVFGDEKISLLHSRFIAPERFEKERILLSELGKPGEEVKRPYLSIVIGTQVIEQSLDIDFDLLITEFCPMDLILQRIGRLHRHQRVRPRLFEKAQCLIIEPVDGEFDAASEIIYGKYLLTRTKAFLPKEIHLPKDISKLVQEVYDEELQINPIPQDYLQSKEKWKNEMVKKEKKADNFRISRVWSGEAQNLIGWLNSDVSSHVGEAAVRDTDESVEVLIVQEKGNGEVGFLPWAEGGRVIPINRELEGKTAKVLARQRVRLPSALCKPWNIENTIRIIENFSRERLFLWQKSVWLRGELTIILGEDFSAVLGDYRIYYDRNLGLSYEREEEKNE